MKKLHTSLFLVLAFALTANAQINLEKTFSPEDFSSITVVHFPINGTKLISYEYIYEGESSLKLYNSDYTLWKTIKIPKGYYVTTVESRYLTGSQFKCEITEALFDTDPSTIEVALYDENSRNIKIAQDDGYVIFESKSLSDLGVIKVDNGYKLVETQYIMENQIPKTTAWNIYSLPGTLPCNDCTNNNNGNTGERPITFEGTGGFLSNPIPNPSSTEVSIGYKLPTSSQNASLQIYDVNGVSVKQVKLHAEQRNITIDVHGLTSGTYFYIINTDRGISSAKKMLVIK